MESYSNHSVCVCVYVCMRVCVFVCVGGCVCVLPLHGFHAMFTIYFHNEMCKASSSTS